MQRSTTTQGTNDLRHTILNYLQAYTRNVRKRHEGRKRRKDIKIETKTNMSSERRPSPERTMLLFVGTISTMFSWWTNRRATHQDQTKQAWRQRAQNKRAVLCPADGPRVLLLVDEARLHVKDAAVRVADLLHLLDHVLGLDVTAFLNRKVRPAVVSSAPRKAANAPDRQDCLGAH